MGRNEFEQLPVEKATESLGEAMLEEKLEACKGFAKIIFEKRYRTIHCFYAT